MNIAVENITFVVNKNQKPDADQLVAVFIVKVWDEDHEAMTLRSIDWKYFVRPNGEGYFLPPAIKTKQGIVRPVLSTPQFRAEVYAAFMDAYRAIKVPPMSQ